MSKGKASVKILVCYHKPAHIFQNEILTPFHVGRAQTKAEDLAGTVLADMPGDDSGDNIATLNPKFCEMTALYWAWRNYAALGDPDYFGLMHYRRLLDFAGTHHSGVLHVSSATDILPGSIAASTIRGVVSRHDICVKSPIKIQLEDYQHTQAFCSVMQQYMVAHNNRYLADTFVTAVTKYPEYARDTEAYLNSNRHYLCNIAVMRKDIFFEYAEWMFSILFEMERRIDYGAPGQDIRAISYLSERLTGLYMTRLRRLGQLDIHPVPSINLNCY